MYVHIQYYRYSLARIGYILDNAFLWRYIPEKYVPTPTTVAQTAGLELRSAAYVLRMAATLWFTLGPLLKTLSSLRTFSIVLQIYI
jgi:hypothetical protein